MGPSAIVQFAGGGDEHEYGVGGDEQRQQDRGGLSSPGGEDGDRQYAKGGAAGEGVQRDLEERGQDAPLSAAGASHERCDPAAKSHPIRLDVYLTAGRRQITRSARTRSRPACLPEKSARFPRSVFPRCELIHHLPSRYPLSSEKRAIAVAILSVASGLYGPESDRDRASQCLSRLVYIGILKVIRSLPRGDTDD